jgi:hypothetical protein
MSLTLLLRPEFKCISENESSRPVAAHPQAARPCPLTVRKTAMGDAPDFVEVGEAGIAMDDAMRRQRRVQLVG